MISFNNISMVESRKMACIRHFVTCTDAARILYQRIIIYHHFMAGVSDPERLLFHGSNAAGHLYLELTGDSGVCSCGTCCSSRHRADSIAVLAFQQFKDYIEKWPPRNAESATAIASTYLDTAINTSYFNDGRKIEGTCPPTIGSSPGQK